MLLIQRTGTVETDLNVQATQKACVVLTGMTLSAAACSPVMPAAALGAGVGLAAIVALNHPFFAFLVRRRGWIFAGAALPLHLLYYCCCGLSVVIALAYWRLRRPATLLPRVDRTAQPAARSAVPLPHVVADRRSSRPLRGRSQSS
jgi:hypothetical protein